MDKSMILELVFNGSCYGENIKMYDNKEYREHLDELNALCERLCKDLPEEEKNKMLDKLFFAQCGMESATGDTFFKEGFKLGLIIGAQSFLD